MNTEKTQEITKKPWAAPKLEVLGDAAAIIQHVPAAGSGDIWAGFENLLSDEL